MYRIKIVTYANGRKAYFAQYKKWYRYVGISCDGEAHIGYSGESYTREDALEKIDKHLSGNTKVVNIDFEYINKK